MRATDGGEHELHWPKSMKTNFYPLSHRAYQRVDGEGNQIRSVFAV